MNKKGRHLLASLILELKHFNQRFPPKTSPCSFLYVKEDCCAIVLSAFSIAICLGLCKIGLCCTPTFSKFSILLDESKVRNAVLKFYFQILYHQSFHYSHFIRLCTVGDYCCPYCCCAFNYDCLYHNLICLNVNDLLPFPIAKIGIY